MRKPQPASFRFVVIVACVPFPPEIFPAASSGAHAACPGPNGCVGDIVVGDFLHRLVAHALGQRSSPKSRLACQPHQFALPLCRGAETAYHCHSQNLLPMPFCFQRTKWEPKTPLVVLPCCTVLCRALGLVMILVMGLLLLFVLNQETLLQIPDVLINVLYINCRRLF